MTSPQRRRTIRRTGEPKAAASEAACGARMSNRGRHSASVTERAREERREERRDCPPCTRDDDNSRPRKGDVRPDRTDRTLGRRGEESEVRQGEGGDGKREGKGREGKGKERKGEEERERRRALWHCLFLLLSPLSLSVCLAVSPSSSAAASVAADGNLGRKEGAPAPKDGPEDLQPAANVDLETGAIYFCR
ncbi:hypothetical protein AXG93_4280s1150 [Marchantia polymorpha subsp. ruderalis]|uniref:Uncharacterized protein n=1 Tax=Marchantia polymorpha subsp. ruderalis TaxID=1480154 RepID=A0A176WP87_MARPO|nr:hypothetical protein AXG93_4280s1150 [Marchantia polymorpha subsp. ruderalis]